MADGVGVEGDRAGVGDVGAIVGGADFSFQSAFDGSPYFFYQSLFFVVIRCVLGTRGSVVGTRGGVLGSTNIPRPGRLVRKASATALCSSAMAAFLYCVV
jgi:hypothetical protein